MIVDEPEKVPGAPETEPDMVDDSRPPDIIFGNLRMCLAYADFFIRSRVKYGESIYLRRTFPCKNTERIFDNYISVPEGAGFSRG